MEWSNCFRVNRKSQHHNYSQGSNNSLNGTAPTLINSNRNHNNQQQQQQQQHNNNNNNDLKYEMGQSTKTLQKKRTTNFRDDETHVLIELWGNPVVQNKLYLTHRKAPVMQMLAASMQARGYKRTPDEIKTRIRNLKCLYHRIQRTVSTGSGYGTVDIDWVHYEAMDRILNKQNPDHFSHNQLTQQQQQQQTSDWDQMFTEVSVNKKFKSDMKYENDNESEMVIDEPDIEIKEEVNGYDYENGRDCGEAGGGGAAADEIGDVEADEDYNNVINNGYCNNDVTNNEAEDGDGDDESNPMWKTLIPKIIMTQPSNGSVILPNETTAERNQQAGGNQTSSITSQSAISRTQQPQPLTLSLIAHHQHTPLMQQQQNNGQTKKIQTKKPLVQQQQSQNVPALQIAGTANGHARLTNGTNSSAGSTVVTSGTTTTGVTSSYPLPLLILNGVPGKKSGDLSSLAAVAAAAAASTSSTSASTSLSGDFSTANITNATNPFLANFGSTTAANFASRNITDEYSSIHAILKEILQVQKSNLELKKENHEMKIEFQKQLLDLQRKQFEMEQKQVENQHVIVTELKTMSNQIQNVFAEFFKNSNGLGIDVMDPTATSAMQTTPRASPTPTPTPTSNDNNGDDGDNDEDNDGDEDDDDDDDEDDDDDDDDDDNDNCNSGTDASPKITTVNYSFLRSVLEQ